MAEDTSEVTETEVTEETAKEKKPSIVPAKYAGRYKSGGSDALAGFINEQSKAEGGFSYEQFFSLCRTNGIPEEQVAKYEGQVAEKRHGSQGRARMTLRNMLATIARKNGKLVGLNGEEVPLEVAKPALSGAAAKSAPAEAESGAEASTF